ncbi:F-box/kelch-repeat protein [Spatholobus suberectus]|nr:F-box/kelch-repeat protein [Spatholobus suberectus]
MGERSSASAPEFRSIDFNASLYVDSASVTLKNKFYDPKPRDNVQIQGSCRGFLLLELNGVLHVWNPSTAAHKFVISSPIVSPRKGRMFYVFLRGFGYDPSTDDYLVVQVSSNLSSPPLPPEGCELAIRKGQVKSGCDMQSEHMEIYISKEAFSGCPVIIKDYPEACYFPPHDLDVAYGRR